jgi:hypothetical protein
MQKLKKKLKLLIVATLISSCQSERLRVVSCVYMHNFNEAFCVDNITREESYIRVNEMDKFTCHSPQDWGKIREFIIQNSRNKTDSRRFFDNIKNIELKYNNDAN